MVLLGAILGMSFMLSSLLCNRCQIKTSNSTLMYKYFLLCIRLVITTLLSPLENLWVHENPEFLYLAPVVQVGSTLIGYILDVYQMSNYKCDTVIKFKMWAFSLFSSTQGLFYDTFMYSLSCNEFNSGVEDSLQASCVAEKILLYVFVFIVFGFVLYHNAIYWNMECSEEENSALSKEISQQFSFHLAAVATTLMVYIGFCNIEQYRFQDEVWLAGYVLTMHLISSLLLLILTQINSNFPLIIFVLTMPVALMGIIGNAQNGRR